MTSVSKKLPLAVAALSMVLLAGCACQPEEAPMAEPVAAAPAAEPAPAPAPAPAPETITLSGDALFDFDKSNLRPDAVEALDTIVQKYKGASLKAMNIVGHTDSKGSDAYNQALSERRAASVREYLASQGLDGSKISTAGRGEADPVASNDTADGRQQNRRVHITAELAR
jgi:outer membrane protein OmpA-like peptidoglycan-associated protein